MHRIYLDCNATTPMDPDVLEAMIPYLSGLCANPSSIHTPGQEARNAVEKARIQVAAALHADPTEIFFTSGGTEANNMAIKGALGAGRAGGSHIVTTAIEHSSVLETLHHLEASGVEISEVPVDRHGRVSPDRVLQALREDTRLVTIGHANNEIGTVQPIDEIAGLLAERSVLFHTDAVQSLGKLALDVSRLGVDMASLSGHKCYGPKGVGVLFIRKGSRIDPLLHGGPQEQKLRAGTENVPFIVGMSRVAEVASLRLEEDRKHYLGLRNRLEEEIEKRIDGIQFHGHPEHRLPQTSNVSIDGIDALTFQIRLDLVGFAVSTGSACSSGSSELSHVHAALGLDEGTSAIRVSLGRMTTEEDCLSFVTAMEEIVKDLRRYV
ncbi:cysteine desulfurase family protein [Acidobacteriota bacterium]